MVKKKEKTQVGLNQDSINSLFISNMMQHYTIAA